MLTLKITRPVKLNERIEISEAQVRTLAEIVQQGQLERVARGLDANDQPFSPLTEPYRRRKLRKGAQGRRDMRLTGRMLDALTVMEATSDGFTVGVESLERKVTQRAYIRQAIDGWFGLSDENAREFDRGLEDLFTDLFEQDLLEAA